VSGSTGASYNSSYVNPPTTTTANATPAAADPKEEGGGLRGGVGAALRVSTPGTFVSTSDGGGGGGDRGDHFASMSPEDLAVMVASLQSEMDAMSRRQEAHVQLSGAQLSSQLESQLGESMLAMQAAVAAQVKETVEAIVCARLEAAGERWKEQLSSSMLVTVDDRIESKAYPRP
jgi:hypothetical protein